MGYGLNGREKIPRAWLDNMGNGFFKGKKVFVTGHTGFKGSWLSQMLLQLGAEVSGYSLKPNTKPNLFSVLGLDESVKTCYSDIRDFSKLKASLEKEGPEIVFHLAAQPLVRDSYDDPLYTFETNAIGTANMLQAIAESSTVKSAVMITTDKVYNNTETGRPFKETDELGGHDPYSASKACAEIIIQSYSRSFFSKGGNRQKGSAMVASARAGNVIGGGDWSKDRLVPDIVRCIFEKKELQVRNPESIRPWQHVLDPLMGYLALAEGLYREKEECAGAWNFSPDNDSFITVEQLLKRAIAMLGKGSYTIKPDPGKHEMQLLRLDSSKAREKLGWRPLLGLEQGLEWTFEWYSQYYSKRDAASFTSSQIRRYLEGKI